MPFFNLSNLSRDVVIDPQNPRNQPAIDACSNARPSEIRYCPIILPVFNYPVPCPRLSDIPVMKKVLAKIMESGHNRVGCHESGNCFNKKI